MRRYLFIYSTGPQCFPRAQPPPSVHSYSEYPAKTPTDFDQFGTMNMPDFNWLPQNFEFDPQLFGDYREPQENILTNGLDDAFFNDAFDVDFTTPYNLPVAAPKKGLIAQIDAAKDDDEASSPGQLLTCNKIWYVSAAGGMIEAAVLTPITGKHSRTARGFRTGTSILTVSAPISRRKQSVRALVRWLTSRIFRL